MSERHSDEMVSPYLLRPLRSYEQYLRDRAAREAMFRKAARERAAEDARRLDDRAGNACVETFST